MRIQNQFTGVIKGFTGREDSRIWKIVPTKLNGKKALRIQNFYARRKQNG